MQSSQKSKQVVLNSQTFKNAVLTANGSKTFLKRLLPTAISYVLHQRINFDKDDFVNHTHNGVQYTTFRGNLKNATLKEIRNWMNGVFDAIDKNYLRELYLIFSNEDNPDHILESYKFKFMNFAEDQYKLNPIKKEQLLESTRELLEAIQTLDCHKVLDHNKTEIKLALTYFQDATPDDYQPPQFVYNEKDDCHLITNLSAHSTSHFILGCIKTGFHRMKCRATGDAFTMDHHKSFSSISEVTEDTKLPDENIATLKLSDIPEEEESLETTTNAIVGMDKIHHENKNLMMLEIPDISTMSLDVSLVAIPNEGINCSCNILENIDKIELIECSSCHNKQHCVCNGFLTANDAPMLSYVCRLCNYPHLTPSEFKLRIVNSICKLIIAVIYFTNEYPSTILDKVSESVKEDALQMLQDTHVLKKINGSFLPNMDIIQNKLVPKLYNQKRKQPRNVNVTEPQQIINLCNDSDGNVSSSPLEPAKKKRKTTRRMFKK